MDDTCANCGHPEHNTIIGCGQIISMYGGEINMRCSCMEYRRRD